MQVGHQTFMFQVEICLLTRPDRIPDPRQKICYWVGQTHSFSFIPRSPTVLMGTSGNACYSDQWSVVSGQCTVLEVPLPAVRLHLEQLTTDNCSLTTA